MRAGDSGLHDVCRQHTAASMGSTAYKTTRRIAMLFFAALHLGGVAEQGLAQKQAWLTRMSCRGAPSLVESTVFTAGLRHVGRGREHHIRGSFS